MSASTMPPPPLTPREMQAKVQADKKSTRSQRPFYKKKRFILPAALAVVIAIVVISTTSKDDSTKTATATSIAAATPATSAAPGAASAAATNAPATDAPAATDLYPARLDSQRDDHEAVVGDGVEMRGYTATVTAAGFEPTVSAFEDDGYIVADLTILNRNDDAQSYNIFDWRLQTPQGTVIDPSFTTMDGVLSSGDLVHGGTVSGKVVFAVGTDPHGEYYLIYKPDPFASDRGIWGVTIP